MPPLVQDAHGETLPALAERRRGIPPRTTLLAAVVVMALLVGGFLWVRDPLGGREQVVHEERPVFNMLYRAGLVREVEPRAGELMRFEASRGAVEIEVTVRPLLLPPYRGELTGVLPLYAERHRAALAARLPSFDVTEEGKVRVNKDPGYQLVFAYGSEDRPGDGRDAFLFEEEYEPGVREGVILSYRRVRGDGRLGPRGRRVTTAMRTVFESFSYGTDRP